MAPSEERGGSKEADENGTGGLVADYSAREVWEPQVEALFDV